MRPLPTPPPKIVASYMTRALTRDNLIAIARRVLDFLAYLVTSPVKFIVGLFAIVTLFTPAALVVICLKLLYDRPIWPCADPLSKAVLILCAVLAAALCLLNVKRGVDIRFRGDVSEDKLRQLPYTIVLALLFGFLTFLIALFETEYSTHRADLQCAGRGGLKALIAVIGVLTLDPSDALARISTQISPLAAETSALIYLAIVAFIIFYGLKLRDLLQGQKYLAALASKHEVIVSLHSSLLPLVINFELTRGPVSRLKRLWRGFFVPQRLVWLTSAQLAQYASTLQDSSATTRNRDALPTIVRLGASLNESLLRAGASRASKTYVDPSLYDRVREFALSSRVSDARRCPNEKKIHLTQLPVSKLVQLSAARLAGEISLEANARSVDLFVIPSNNSLANENDDKNRSESIVCALAEFAGWLALFLAREGCSVRVRGEHSMTEAIEAFYEEQRDQGLRIWNTRFQTGERLWKVEKSGSDASTAHGSSDSRGPGSVEAWTVKLIDLCYDREPGDRAAKRNTDLAETLKVVVREDGAQITEYAQAVGRYHYDLVWPGVSINQQDRGRTDATGDPIQKPVWAIVSRKDIDWIAERELK